jgi:hypothetical protein
MLLGMMFLMILRTLSSAIQLVGMSNESYGFKKKKEKKPKQERQEQEQERRVPAD